MPRRFDAASVMNFWTIFLRSFGGCLPFVVIRLRLSCFRFKNRKSHPRDAVKVLSWTKLSAFAWIVRPSMQPPLARIDLIHWCNSFSMSGYKTFLSTDAFIFLFLLFKSVALMLALLVIHDLIVFRSTINSFEVPLRFFE
jgi:hypothetical protein